MLCIVFGEIRFSVLINCFVFPNLLQVVANLFKAGVTHLLELRKFGGKIDWVLF